MKRTLFWMTIIGCVVSVWMLNHVSAGRESGRIEPQAASAILSDAEKADLLFMREEEKLARDVYVMMHAAWGDRVFNNIIWSEQSHMNAMLRLLETYELPDPALEPGLFTNEELQKLFDTLVDSGLNSRLDALRVGALIEEIDIEDIAGAVERTIRKDILTVYGNLLKGSKNHLIAFVRNIEGITGQDYEAQWISQDEVDEILGR